MKPLNQIFVGKCIVLGVYLTISGNLQIAPKADFSGIGQRGSDTHASESNCQLKWNKERFSRK